MKLFIVVLCLLPLVFAEKRLIIDSILNVGEIKNLVNTVVGSFGSDATEQQCESECVVLFTNNLIDSACDLACLGIQSLIKRFYHAPPVTTVQA